MKQNSLVRFALIALAGVIMTGCATQQSWTYKASPMSSSPVIVQQSVAVPPFADARLNQNSNMAGLYLIPLMPFGWMDLNTPEGVVMTWKWRPNEDLAKAAVEEMNSSRIFKEVFFSHRASEGTLVMQGTINSTKYSGKIFSYGLSAYGPILWLIGLPATTVNNDLDVTLSLRNQTTNAILWEKNYKRKKGHVSWIYAVKSDFLYADLYKDILVEAMRDIRNAAPNFPKTEPTAAAP
jgi:hypothetical protein